MDIAFNPPIGEFIQLETSLSSQTAPLHFTAELSVHDHDKLVQDRARIQLWSDLPRNGQSSSDGGWGALDFTDQAQDLEEMSSCKISLGSTYPIHASEEKVTLFLDAIVALPMGLIPRFSFTYRIVYPSGDIQWLGAFGQNGSLSFERSDHDWRDFGLDAWTFDKSKMARIYEVKQSVGALDVASVKNVYDYCVRAIGPTSFVSDLKEAVVLFFTPRSQPSAIRLSPTYVFSASPGASMTLSVDGRVAVSGSGTLLFQVNEGHLEPLTFVRRVLSHAKLDRWNILASDADSNAIVLTTPKDKFPIKAVAIPLWHSEGLNRPIYLEATALSDILGTTEFSIFSPDNMRIHLFIIDPQATQKNQMVSLKTDNTGNSFVMSPIHTLRGYQVTTDKPPTIWKTVILSPYQVQDFSADQSGTLPTPPPSPHVQPVARLSQAHAPSLINGNHESKPPPPPSPLNPDTDARVQKRPSLSVTRNILTMFGSLFFSVYFSVFYRFFFWGRRTSDSLSYNATEDHPRQWAPSVSEDDVGNTLDQDAPDDSEDEFCASESLVKNPETEIPLGSIIETQTTKVQPSQSDTGYTVSTVSHASDNTKRGCDVYLHKPSDSGSKKITTIALLCTTHNDPAEATTTDPNTSNIIDKNEIMEYCIQFLDGSKPECLMSKCDVDVFCHTLSGEGQDGNDSKYSCCLLQYQMDWGSDLGKSERKIRISPPKVT